MGVALSSVFLRRSRGLRVLLKIACTVRYIRTVPAAVAEPSCDTPVATPVCPIPNGSPVLY